MTGSLKVMHVAAACAAIMVALAVARPAPALAGSIVIAQAGLNSSNVATVYYPGGRFTRIGPNRWVEIGDNGARFEFVEQGYDETTVYLLDASRDVQIGLDVSTSVILYAHASEPFSQLYVIIGAEIGGATAGPAPGVITGAETGSAAASAAPAASSHTVTYSCNEGIPLVVRYEYTPAQSVAFASHDGFPAVRLDEAVSGSGARYVGGAYELHVKGPTAVFTFDGSEDICHED